MDIDMTGETLSGRDRKGNRGRGVSGGGEIAGDRSADPPCREPLWQLARAKRACLYVVQTPIAAALIAQMRR
jgi:hypothetical protein